MITLTLLYTFYNSSFAIRIYVGGVNAVTGKACESSRAKNNQPQTQDYVVAPEQKWVDGVRTTAGTVRQFVAMPTGSEYSVEKQVTGKESIEGIQMEIIPQKPS